MKNKKSVPVAPQKRDQNVIVVEVPRGHGRRDHVINRHAGRFSDRRKKQSKMACRTSRSKESGGDFFI